MEETREHIINIKKELRLFMNGVTSTQQRKLGMSYNIIFGVEIPRLKEIAAKFPIDAGLAKALWKENIRESKLLAIFLLPEENYAEVAEEWIGECRYRENADNLAHTILSKLPDATERALKWICNSEELYCYCGFITLAHIFRSGKGLTDGQEKQFFTTASGILKSPTPHSNASQAMKALTFYCEDDGKATRFNTFHGEEII